MSMLRLFHPSPTQLRCPIASRPIGQFAITATNNGPSDSTGVAVTDTLPPETTFVSANPTQGTCSEAAGVVTCNFGELANGASAIITIVVTVDISLKEGALITNTAQVSGDEDDPDGTNDTVTEDTSVIRRADIEVTKAVDEMAPRRGRHNPIHHHR